MRLQNIKLHYLDDEFLIQDWHIDSHAHWGVLVTHAHWAEALSEWFVQHAETAERKVSVVSLKQQQRLLAREIANDETDLQDHIDYGSSVEELIHEVCGDPTRTHDIIEQCHLSNLRTRGFRQLSTGETRRVMLARALAEQPELLVLDDPFAGLDKHHRQWLSTFLDELSAQTQLIIIATRDDNWPQQLTHMALFDDRSLQSTCTMAQWQQHPVRLQMQALSLQESEAWLALIESYPTQKSPLEYLLQLENAKVEYSDGIIFRDFTWRVQPGEHWQIRGPNGCGKSTLLGLITGDHPQCYANHVEVLGIRRGQGESIWQVKKAMGIVSSSLHLQYRISCTVFEVLLSGFYDSIGLYENPSARERQLATQWLDVLAMSKLKNMSFQRLNYGQQRLLLIVRALIKQPALLILDEPYQGLDALSRRLVMTVLDALAETSLTHLLYVTHYDEDSLRAVKHFVDFELTDHGYYQPMINHSN